MRANIYLFVLIIVINLLLFFYVSCSFIADYN
nr:MAG TPA: hypothetical protein [Bacteriophage sp.]